jgi:hypothetical protein
MAQPFKSAIILGAAPLLAGTLIYATWRLTQWHWLEIAGLLNILFGFAAFVAGSVAPARHLRSEWRVGDATRGRLWLQALSVGGLLLVNFPAAAFFALSAIDVETRYKVRVSNDSNRPIESLIVAGPGVRVELGPIAPGQLTRRNIHFDGDGTLDFLARQQQTQFGGQLEGYVTGGWNGDKTIRVRQGGTFDIESNDD